jgi:hypothetical protein
MKHYAIREDTGKRVLVDIECDGCGAIIKPNPEIGKSGWRVCGYDKGAGTDKLRFDYCPTCVPAWSLS